MADDRTPLGAFLRARRELVTPERAGLDVVGPRRVPGLRREEVAMLAGISADYYLRLEQGRDRNPSVQVLEAIARVLQLDDDTLEHLLGLIVDTVRPARRRSRKESIPPGAAGLVTMLPLPAFVEGRYLDVLAANVHATALSPRLLPGRNRLRDVFQDPAEQQLSPDWDKATAALAAGFRQSVGTDTDDPRCIELVGELSLASARFARLWARHDVANRRSAVVRFDHPLVGELSLHREKLLVAGSDGIMLVVYHPEPGSAAAEKLSLLGSMTTSTR